MKYEFLAGCQVMIVTQSGSLDPATSSHHYSLCRAIPPAASTILTVGGT